MALYIGSQNLSNEVRQLRVAVASDALDQWRLSRFELLQGAYLQGTFPANISLDNKQLRDVLPEVRDCKVCMMGACLLSLARVDDKIPAAKFSMRAEWADSMLLTGYSHGGEELIRRVFDADTRIFLESFFEDWTNNISDLVAETSGYSEWWEISEWAYDVMLKRYPTAETRFEAVLQNLIDNDGVIEVEALMGPLPMAT